MILSYVIPVYNGSATIVRCLDSIYNSGMNMSDFEIIVVDDCSSDDTVETVEQYAIAHPNIRLLRHDVNKKQGGAKNTGIRAASGKYIAFADQDDEVVSENLKKVLEVAKAGLYDMVSFRWIERKNGEDRLCGLELPDNKSFSGVSFCEDVFDAAKSLAPWSYIYRRDYLMAQNRPMAEYVLMEDSDWIAWHLIHARSVLYVNIPIYKWIRNSSSITAGVSYQHKADWVLFGLRKIEDSYVYRDLSPSFSSIMERDGRYNIERSLRTLWKADKYAKFYEKLGNEALASLKKMKWSFRTNWIFHHPRMTCLLLALIGPIMKTLRKI